MLCALTLHVPSKCGVLFRHFPACIYYGPFVQALYIVTLCACARGKVIRHRHCRRKPKKRQTRRSALCHQTVESYKKLSSVCFKSLRTAHKHYKSCVSPATPIDHTYQCHVLFPLCMLEGKGRQVIVDHNYLHVCILDTTLRCSPEG